LATEEVSISAIGGIISCTGKPVAQEALTAMNSAMVNRGSDAQGFWHSEKAGLVQKALWTTPESRKEDQPIQNSDNNLILVSDARIDNRQDLMARLDCDASREGQVTDAELILESYQRWGTECANYLRGDFCFAIWDQSRKELYCARDPVATRPFYFARVGGYFLFSSEISGLFSFEDFSRKPDRTAIKQWLTNETIPYKATLFEGVEKLPAAHFLQFKDGIISTRRYWFPENIRINQKISEQEATKEFNRLFRISIEHRIRCGEPVGCMVSGGLDSSAVYCVLHEMGRSQEIPAYSRTFGALETDETLYIDAVMTKTGGESVTIQSDTLDYCDRYSVERLHSEPCDWPIGYAFTDMLAMLEQARDRGIRVMLTGIGGDNVLEGSNFMLADFLKQGKFFSLANEIIHNKLSWKELKHYMLYPLLPDKITHNLGKNSWRKLPYFIDEESVFEDIEEKAGKGVSFAMVDELAGVFGSYWSLGLEAGFYGLGGRFGIEFRHPFFDKDIIEFLLSLPPQLKLRHGTAKVLLRKAMVGILPDLVRNRSDKGDFTDFVAKLNSEINFPEFWTSSELVKQDLLKGPQILKLLTNGSHSNRSLWKLRLYYVVECWMRANFQSK
jgi:asparagine synthase (glutamine-hydrolysing)